MKEQLIQFETANLAREKGFNWHCDWRYDEIKQDLLNWKDYRVQQCIDEDRSYAYKAIDSLEELYYDEFDNDDVGFYVSAPTQSLLQKWVREIHNLSIEASVGENKWQYCILTIKGFTHIISSAIMYDTYEEALEDGLIKALKLI